MAKKKSSHRSSLSIRHLTIGAIIVILLCLGYAYKTHVASPPDLRVDLTDKQSQPNSRWKTFTNNDYHFSFRYPPQFRVSEKKEVFNSTGFSGEKVNITRYTYLLSTGLIVNGQPDWSGFAINVESDKGKTLTEFIHGNGVSGRIAVTPFISENGADESGVTVNIENGVRAYRKGNLIFSVGTLQDANTYDAPKASDFFGTYEQGIFDSIHFN